MTIEYAIKQSDEERAMFAKMGGGRGKGKGYSKRKSKLYKKRGDAKPAANSRRASDIARRAIRATCISDHWPCKSTCVNPFANPSAPGRAQLRKGI